MEAGPREGHGIKLLDQLGRLRGRLEASVHVVCEGEQSEGQQATAWVSLQSI